MKKLFLLILIICSFFWIAPMSLEAAQYGSVAAIVDTDGSNLNVRSSNNTSSSIITRLPDSSYLTLISTHGNFYYVEYADNKFGYVHKDYVTWLSTDARKVNTGGANLNVRTGPSTNYSIKDKVVNGDYVVILSDHGSFSKVLYKGNNIGYVANDYLESSYKYKSISLSVPNYKQYDSRWANVVIGNSGSTIKQIGCLTTAMAMTESHRTGSTYTPLTIRNTASYTSDGNMYWPSHYTTSIPSSYLTTIYNQLKIGKPVIVGFKNSSGGQHWVVVTGYVGGNSLTASGFIVNDPGSSSRTRLNQVISAYPTFYKLAYYK